MLFEIIIVLLIVSCSLFIHEMGHAVATVTVSKNSKAEVFMGSSSKANKLRLSFGRITCYLTIAISGYCEYSIPKEYPVFTYKQKFFFYLSGPIASLLCSVALFIASHFVSGVAGNIIMNSAGVNFLLFITSLIPWTYPRFLGGGPSDGLQILNLVKANRDERKFSTQ
ncbi:site-2 protease family protein [Planococcus citreus]|uniref:Peptidase M50 domain-containing protein n=1 Tax=Planococcus citreus TaxID=1373 RepID=A0A497YJ25_9BACL|nr:site-2 protease family protein [Planococcus citreus]RLJ87018.1 hypothetical protein DFR62_1816 [Planococcus citreus]